MKVNLQKTLIIFLVLSIVLTIFNIAVFADTEPSAMTNKEYYAAQSYLIDKYCDGEITYEQFQEQSQAVTNEYVTANTVGGVLQGGALNASNTVSALTQKVGSTVDKYGDEARVYVSDWWNSTCNKKGVPTETTQTSNMDMKGYGALLNIDYVDPNYWDTLNYCDFIVIYRYSYGDYYDTNTVSKNGQFIMIKNGSIGTQYATQGSNHYSGGSGSMGKIENSDSVKYLFYGDVRYEDGTSYPTDDEYTTATVKKYYDMTEKQLEDLIDNFSDKITLENPDLSSLEGLLNAIYARMGTLDSDNDNELLSEILVAIKALNGVSGDNSDILKLLTDIKNALVYDDGENTETFSKQLKVLIENQITSDDFIIDEDMYKNNDDVLKERLLGKFSFIDDMKTFVVHCFDTYKESANKPKIEFEYNSKKYSIDFDFFEQFMSDIRILLAVFIYITYAYHTYRKIPSYINGGDNE